MIDTARALVLVLAAALASGGTVLTIGLLGPAADGGVGSDFGLDTDGNGKFEWLVVDASVTLPETGLWDVSASLFGSTSPTWGTCVYGGIRLADGSPAPWPITSVYERYFFEAGAQSVRLAFTGTDIERAGVDGPYTVQASLYQGGYFLSRETGILPPEYETPYVQWNYTTRAYASADFEAPVRPVAFTGTHADEGVHVDSDGLYDVLALSAGVQVNTPGTYGISGSLTSPADPSDPYTAIGIAWAYADVSLEAGDDLVTLYFRGDQIRMAGVDGPWAFSLTIYPTWPLPYEGGNGTTPGPYMHPIAIYPEVLCGTTSAHSAGSFDDTAELVRYTGTFEESGLDRDGDGRFEALLIRAQVESFTHAGFDFAGTLSSADGSHDIAYIATQGYLPAGLSWTEWWFPGGSIASAGIDGPYRAVLSITPTAIGVDPVTTYTTEPYRATDFEGEPANRTMYWISSLSATAAQGAIRVDATVQRGYDLLTVVMQDVLTLTVYDDSRGVSYSTSESVYLPSGGSSQSFGWSVDGLESGTYTVVAVLGEPDAPVDVWSVSVTI
jgi:hypothetical protein